MNESSIRNCVSIAVFTLQFSLHWLRQMIQRLQVSYAVSTQLLSMGCAILLPAAIYGNK